MAKVGRKRMGAAGFVEAVLWVADHVGEPGMSRLDAPSGLAWSLWRWVLRQGEDKFFSILLPRALAVEVSGGEDGLAKAEGMSLARIESLVRPLMGGVERRFCERCWRELGGEGGCLEGVRVVHLARRVAVGVESEKKEEGDGDGIAAAVGAAGAGGIEHHGVSGEPGEGGVHAGLGGGDEGGG